MSCVGNQDSAMSGLQSPGVVRPSPSKKSLRTILKRAVSEHDVNERYWLDKRLPPTPTSSRTVSHHHNDGASIPPPSAHGRSRTWTTRSLKKSISSLDQSKPKSYSSTMTPPPYDLALNRALLREILDVPAKSSDSVFSISLPRRKGSRQLSLDLLKPGEALVYEPEGANDPKQTASILPKTFILTKDQCLLQYDTAGDRDRMPEKILPLGPRSTAIASDAIPGRHWVLAIVRDGRTPTQEPTTKGGRPKLFSRGSESKKHVKQVLLVFDSAWIFDKWLSTIRKEIEALGGLRYRPDSQDLEQKSLRSPRSYRDLFRHANVASPLSFSFPPKGQDTLDDAASQSSLPKSTSSSRSRSKPTLKRSSTAGSSVQTTTNLDTLRSSLTSDGSTWSGTRSSYADSYAGEAATAERALAIREIRQILSSEAAANAEATSRKKRPAPLTLTVPETSTRQRSASCSPILPSPSLPRTPTIPVDEFFGMTGSPFSHKQTPENSSVTAKEMEIWLAKVTQDMRQAFASLKTSRPGSIVDPLPAQTDSKVVSSDAKGEGTNGSGDQSNSSMKTATSRRNDQGQLLKPPTCIAPRRSSLADVKAKNAVTIDSIANMSPPDLNTFSSASQAPDPKEVTDANPHSRSLSKSVARKKNLSITMNMQAPTDTDIALQRSPAVNNVHFATCFGLDSPFEKASVQIDGESLDFPMTSKTLSSMSPPLSRDSEETRRPDTSGTTTKYRRGHKKSLSNSIHRFNGPTSAPPTGPLPAVPDQTSPATTARSSPERGTRNKFTSSRSSSTKKKQRAARAQFDNIQQDRRSSHAPLSFHPASKQEIRHMGRPSSSQLGKSKPLVSKTHSKHNSATLTTFTEKILPTPTAVVTPATPDPVSSPSTPTVPISFSPVSPFTPPADLTALPVQMEIKGYPFPLVIHSE